MKGIDVKNSLRYWLGRKLSNAGARLLPPPAPIKSPALTLYLHSSYDAQNVATAVLRRLSMGGYGSA